MDRIRSLITSIDIFFANAGISRASNPLSVDGLEPVFATNHVGHYALTTRLLPLLINAASKENADVRIVITSSNLSWYSRRIKFDTLTSPFDEKHGRPVEMYTRSKLANILFGMKLAGHVRERGYPNIHVNIAEPGIIFGTDVHRQMESAYSIWTRLLVIFLYWTVALSLEDGALTMLYLGTSPVIAEDGISGQFYRPFGNRIPPEKYPKHATRSLSEELWEWTENFVSKREAELRVQWSSNTK